MMIHVVDHLTVVLPGGNNDPWTPPVLLPALALEQQGATVERISYGHPRPAGLGLEDSQEFNEAVAAQVAEVVERHEPHRITFVAKSRGTLFLAAMDDTAITCLVDASWGTTPLVGLDDVGHGIIGKRWRSLLVAGGADPYHDQRVHDEVRTAIGAEELVIPGANHGLVVERDPLATADGYRRLAEASVRFVGPTR